MHSIMASASWRYWLPSIHFFVFLGQFFFMYFLFIFHIPKFFFSKNIFSLLAPLLYNIVFFLCSIINFFLSFLSTTLHEHVANSILYCLRLLYFSSIFLMASTGEAVPSMFLVCWTGDECLIIKQGGIHIFWSFCGFKGPTDAVRRKWYQKPSTYAIKYYFILKKWLALKWIS